MVVGSEIFLAALVWPECHFEVQVLYLKHRDVGDRGDVDVAFVSIRGKDGAEEILRTMSPEIRSQTVAWTCRVPSAEVCRS